MYGVRLLRQRPVQLAALGLVGLLVLAFRALQFALLTREIQWGYDFSAYWFAGQGLLLGMSPYDEAQLAGPYSPQQQFLYLYPPPLAAVTSRSYHSAGVNTLLMDGSVRFVSNSVSLATWRALVTGAGGEVVGADF